MAKQYNRSLLERFNICTNLCALKHTLRLPCIDLPLYTHMPCNKPEIPNNETFLRSDKRETKKRHNSSPLGFQHKTDRCLRLSLIELI